MIPEGKLVLKHKKVVARDTVELLFDVLNDFSFESGQFISLKVGEKAWRAYSIASNPQNDEITLIVRLIEGGTGSEYLRKMEIGEEITYRGAFGRFVLPKEEEKTLRQAQDGLRPLIMAATGTGIAPFRAMLLDLQAKNAKTSVTLWYGGRNEDDIAYLDDLADWYDNLEVKLAFSRVDSLSEAYRQAKIGRITQFVGDLTEKAKAEAVFLLCGNGDMVLDVEKRLLDAGIDKKRVEKERFN